MTSVRAPLTELPLSLFPPILNSQSTVVPGSPTKLILSPGMSIPCKRPAPPPSPTTTPKARRLQSSPARRLFADRPETPESERSSASASSSRRTLAPSPPIVPSIRRDLNLDIHDPGFVILPDPSSPPPSRPKSITRSSHDGPTTPKDKSPSSIENDQENVPPALSDSYVHLPSPSVHLSSPSSARSARKRSRLAPPDPPTPEDEGDDEELTPGRTREESKEEREARRRRLVVEL